MTVKFKFLSDKYQFIDKNKSVIPEDIHHLKHFIHKQIKLKGTNCDLNFIDVSEITDMKRLFDGLDFNGNISDWDVSNVTDMSYMFSYSNFNGDISKWNTSKVTFMNSMFSYSEFNGDI